MKLNSALKYFALALFFCFTFLSYFMSHQQYDIMSCLLISGQLFLIIFCAWGILTIVFPQKLVAYFLSLFYIFDFLLVFYFLMVHIRFNWFYFWYNRHDAFLSLRLVFDNFYLSLFILFIFFLVIARLFLLLFVDLKFKKTKIQYTVYCFAFLFVLFSSGAPNKAEFFTVLGETFGGNSQIINLYSQKYNDILAQTKQTNKQNIATHGNLNIDRSIFFLHLESLNSSVVSEDITPNFYKLQSEGLVFKNLQTNNIQTIRSEENILCPVLPSFGLALHQQDKSADLYCLPAIFKDLGYKTLFFKDDDLSFADTGDFMLSLGFDEVHNSDIMKPGDKALPWGYREDIFYQRVLEYLELYKDQKIFVYIAVSATNHFPFNTYDNYQDLNLSLPLQDTKNIKERIVNTSFLQDYFFGQFLEKWRILYHDKAHLFAFGDQAWPTQEHGNYHNEAFAWQENFVSSLAIVSPQIAQENYGLKNDYVNQLDIFPTTLSLNDVTNTISLGVDLLADNERRKCIISVQPYSRRYIVVIEYPKKYLYNILDNRLEIYDLEQDPQEKNPIFQGPADDISYLENCLNTIVD